MVTTNTFEPGLTQGRANQGCVGEIIVTQLTNLLLPFGRIYGFGGALDRVRHAVELGGMASIPQRMQ